MVQDNVPMRFDPQLRVGSPDLKVAIDVVARDLLKQEMALGLRLRARKHDDRRKFTIAAEALICNLLLLRLTHSNASLAIPRDHNVMWAKSRYRARVYGQHFLSLLDLLERLKLLSKVQTGYRVSKTLKAHSLVQATNELFAGFPAVTAQSFRRDQEPEVLILKAGRDDDGKAALVEYRESPRTRQLRREVEWINERLLNADIALVDADTSLQLGEDGEVIAPYRRTLRRTFNNKSWQQGGRLAGGFWMTMRRVDRFLQIRIAGEAPADVDYQQLFPRLAYARALAAQPPGDLYDVVGDSTGRDGWKLLLNALLFNRGPLRRWPRECSQHFPGMPLKTALALLREKHEPIAHLFGTGVGFELMHIESEMLIAVVTHLFKNGIVALPLHDAVLVAASHACIAQAAMEDEFRARTGQPCAFVKVDSGPDTRALPRLSLC